MSSPTCPLGKVVFRAKSFEDVAPLIAKEGNKTGKYSTAL